MDEPIFLHHEVTSTNDLALEAAEDGAPHGACWVAEHQTEGRGRREVGGERRTWFSPPGTSIYMSVLLRPDIAPSHASGLTLAAGVGICEALQTQLDVWIKWPNDLYVGQKKLGGILTEAVTHGTSIDAVVVGVGVNVNVGDDDVPDELRDIMTSVRMELGFRQDRLQLLHPLRNAVLRWCGEYAEKGYPAIQAPLQTHDRSRGLRVEVSQNGDWVPGESLGIDENGELSIELDEGGEVSVSSGEARILFDR